MRCKKCGVAASFWGEIVQKNAAQKCLSASFSKAIFDAENADDHPVFGPEKNRPDRPASIF